MELLSPTLRIEFREFCVGLVLRQIDDIFQMSGVQLGTVPKNRITSGARRTRVEEYYASIDWTSVEDVQKFLQVIGLVLSQTDIPIESKNFIREICEAEGLLIDGHQVQLPTTSNTLKDLFIEQFPVGLPFGVVKPDFAITAKEGSQSLRFELKSGLGIIWQNVYPNFDFQIFQEACGIEPSTNLALKQALVNMNQTENEKTFFQAYARHFGMADKHIPMLIPQAWIQWHSLPKKILRASNKPIADELYRVDFVAFWGNQRFAILIDDISHYAVKKNNLWIADEKSYSKRLEEDRKLQAEGWRIFRVSNWEIRQNRVQEIFMGLRKFIGF